MHEMSLLRPTVDLVLEECERAGVTRVSAVHLSIGVLRDVIEDYMEGLFQHLARGTAAAGAKLVIKRIPAVVICNECATPFPIDVHAAATWTCPHCGAHKNYRLYSGNEFKVDRIEVSETRGATGTGAGAASPAARPMQPACPAQPVQAAC